MRRLVQAATACLTAAVAACGSSGTTGASGTAGSSERPTAAASAAAESTTVSCPPAQGADSWPKQAPAKLPVPDGLKVESVQQKPNIVIRFTVPDDFHNTVRYLLDALPKAGFTLGTGDSEAEEADIPFSVGDVHASIKVNDVGTCMTGGLLAVTP